jgi:hypothetical protein
VKKQRLRLKTIANSVLSNIGNGLRTFGGVTWLAKNVISGNTAAVAAGGTTNSYGDNYIAGAAREWRARMSVSSRPLKFVLTSRADV